ncbi:DUF3298 and DUF4163 domain-containing protein [Cytobacillus purgationiresistens]|uniref:DUF3298/DUF4163 domain-containing protein n=1 Tax=Cytobacillus purgationiresistens TaxID=863449 RepID=A0ABU0AJG0_9BACI|nr:DUF3298 and DUF4163 domain-containing protein [Cytobacillus purgationiresistens]MDQ0271404.1 hypothetical protein [Cytobacillus purgationiresistens]
MNQSLFPAGIKPKHIQLPKTDVFEPEVYAWTPPQAQARMNKKINKTLWKFMHDQGYGQPESTLTGGFDLKNNQQGILSLTMTIYSYSGGAHGITLEKGLTFDIFSGKSYNLKDLFKEGSNYTEKLNILIQAQIAERNLKDNLLAPYPGISATQPFYVADKTLVIYFDVYELLPYVYGTIYFPISIYSLQDTIKEDGPLGKLM